MITALITIIIIISLVFLYKKYSQKLAKEIQEDIIKHSYYLSKENKEVNIYSISGRSNIPINTILKYIKKLENENLIIYNNGKILLTEKGKQKALEIIRAHRLYEKYLYEYTSIPKEELHKIADKIEHQLTEEQIKKLEKSLGFPIYDPHGDPIPTKDGKLPPLNWKKISEIPINSIIKIVHIEDEPENVYINLINKTLSVKKIYKLIDKNPISLLDIRTQNVIKLDKIEANNLHVIILEEEPGELIPLSFLKPGEEAEVISISKDCPTHTRRRFLELGFVKGSKVKVYLQSIFKEPTAYIVKDSYIALRKEQAEKILVKKRAS